MKRRDFVAGGVGAAFAAPVLAQGLDEWKSPFIDKWVKGAWRVEYPDKSSAPTLFEVYGCSPATDDKGAFDLRGGTSLFKDRPGPARNARATRVSGSGALVSLGNSGGSGRFEIEWRAGETQEGTIKWLKDDKVSPVRLRRLSAAEIDEQRSTALGGEKPIFINTSYFG